MEKASGKDKLIDLLLMTAGTLLVTAGVYFFKFPNHFSIGGVSGISVILGALVPGLTPGVVLMGINVVLLVIGFFAIGGSFTFRTIYCSLLFSLSTAALEWIIPMTAPMTDQPLLELTFAMLLTAVGSAILFNISASTGGTDIVAMILKKYTSFDIGVSLLVVDFAITITSGFVFGIEIGLLSVLGLIAKTLVVDNVIESINMSKYFFIIADKPEEICEYINKNLHKGATIWEAKGAYTGEPRHIILAVMKRHQAVSLKKYIKTVDKNAFVIAANTSDIIGKGFRALN